MISTCRRQSLASLHGEFAVIDFSDQLSYKVFIDSVYFLFVDDSY